MSTSALKAPPLEDDFTPSLSRLLVSDVGRHSLTGFGFDQGCETLSQVAQVQESAKVRCISRSWPDVYKVVKLGVICEKATIGPDRLQLLFFAPSLTTPCRRDFHQSIFGAIMVH
jgi:hypothetical protein